jgi:hypothetical protein
VDLLVALRHQRGGARTAARIIEALNPRFPVDLIVRSEMEIARRLKQQDFFLQQAMREGRVIYEATHT